MSIGLADCCRSARAVPAAPARRRRTPTATSRPPPSSSAPRPAAGWSRSTSQEGDTLAADAVVGTIDAVELGLAARSARRRSAARMLASERGRRSRSTCCRPSAMRRRPSGMRARAQSAALEAQQRDRPPHLRAHPAAVRAAGGHRAAARSGRAGRRACSRSRSTRRTTGQGAGQPDSSAHPADRGDAGAAADRGGAGDVGGRADRAGRTSGCARARSPTRFAGTVLTTYAKAGEFVQPGQPLYKIANLDSRGGARLRHRAAAGAAEARSGCRAVTIDVGGESPPIAARHGVVDLV